MWWIIGVILLTCVVGVALGLRQHFILKRNEDEFFEEIKRLFDYAIPTEDMTHYETIRSNIHNIWKQQQQQSSSAPPETEGGEGDSDQEDEPEDSWQRQVHPPIKAQLMTALVKRAMAVIPRFTRMMKEWEPKYLLHKQHLLSDRHWQLFDEAQNDLSREIRFIRHEAECIRPGWGKGDKVFEDAAVLLRHHLDKQQKEAYETEMRKEKEAAELARIEAVECQNKASNKMMATVMREEEQTPNKAKRRANRNNE